jgi:hypothetical protein
MSYLVKVQNFFLKNDPDRYYLAKRITRTFRADEDAVMARLEEIYAKGGPKKLKVKDIANTKNNKKVETLSDSDAVENSSSDIPKKSKKKLLTIIALLILAIVGVGVFMKMGDGSNNENPIVEPVENESEESSKSIEEIEKVIEDAEKDSVVNDIIEAAEAIELIR